MKVRIRGAREIQRMLARLASIAGRGSGRAALHARYAIAAQQWIDRNFRTEGGLVGKWKPLSQNTIAGRRKGTSTILQDRGLLRASFLPAWDEDKAVVGSAMEISKWHEEGTRPYTIKPRRGKFLAFPHAGGTPLRRATFFPSAERTFPKGTPFIFTKGPVEHPGLPQRRLLPTSDELMPRLVRITDNYVREQARRT